MIFTFQFLISFKIYIYIIHCEWRLHSRSQYSSFQSLFSEFPFAIALGTFDTILCHGMKCKETESVPSFWYGAHTPNTIHCTCKSKLTNNGTNSSISRCCVQTTNSRICIQMIRVLWSTLLFDAMNILFAFVANLCNYRASIYSSVPFAIHFLSLDGTFPSSFPSFHPFWCFQLKFIYLISFHCFH